jgi:hypothetical protein
MSVPEKRSPAPLAGGNRAGIGFAEQQSYIQNSVGDQASTPQMQLRQWRPVSSGALRGRATVVLPIGLEISNVAVFRTAAATWAQLPADAARNGRGETIRDENGKTVYRSSLKWVGRELQQQFSDAVIRLIVDAYGPAAFDGGGE